MDRTAHRCADQVAPVGRGERSGALEIELSRYVETFPQEQMMEPGDVAEVVLTILGLSDNTSIAELVIICRDDVTM